MTNKRQISLLIVDSKNWLGSCRYVQCFWSMPRIYSWVIEEPSQYHFLFCWSILCIYLVLQCHWVLLQWFLWQKRSCHCLVGKVRSQDFQKLTDIDTDIRYFQTCLFLAKTNVTFCVAPVVKSRHKKWKKDKKILCYEPKIRWIILKMFKPFTYIRYNQICSILGGNFILANFKNEQNHPLLCWRNLVKPTDWHSQTSRHQPSPMLPLPS